MTESEKTRSMRSRLTNAILFHLGVVYLYPDGIGA